MELRALLIFADSAHTDLKRRGWPSAFRVLLETQSFSLEEKPGFDVHLFTSRGYHHPDASARQVHFQEGATFGQKLENAIESLARLGYQEIVIVGRDCPELEQSDIRLAFELLRQHQVVLGPDHRGGCYLIGIHANDRGTLNGIRWQRNTDFRQLLDSFGEQNICRLAAKLDLDSLGDVWLLARSQTPWRILSKSLKSWLLTRPALSSRTPKISCIENQRELWQFPPPQFAAL